MTTNKKSKRLIIEVSEEQLLSVKTEALKKGLPYRKLVLETLASAGILEIENDKQLDLLEKQA